MSRKILVVGSTNIDLIMKMDRLPEKGETVTDGLFRQVFGGKGANQAVAAARAGGEVAFVSCIGEGAYTRSLMQKFEDSQIDTTHIFKEPNEPTGMALIMIGKEGENYISVARGANAKLTPDQIDQARPAFESAGLILLQCEIPEPTIKRVIDLADELNIPVLWNFAPTIPFDPSYLGKVEILVVNQVEASFLANQTVSDWESALAAAQSLLSLGTRMVLLTLGSDGAVLLLPDQQIAVPAFKVAALDTTAAGDVFCGTFAVAYLEKQSLEEALRFASAASAICVGRMGAMPSIPYRPEIRQFLLNQ
ncbi:MAG: ribokinase [Bacteroidota bacterium]